MTFVDDTHSAAANFFKHVVVIAKIRPITRGENVSNEVLVSEKFSEFLFVLGIARQHFVHIRSASALASIQISGDDFIYPFFAAGSFLQLGPVFFSHRWSFLQRKDDIWCSSGPKILSWCGHERETIISASQVKQARNARSTCRMGVVYSSRNRSEVTEMDNHGESHTRVQKKKFAEQTTNELDARLAEAKAVRQMIDLLEGFDDTPECRARILE